MYERRKNMSSLDERRKKILEQRNQQNQQIHKEEGEKIRDEFLCKEELLKENEKSSLMKYGYDESFIEDVEKKFEARAQRFKELVEEFQELGDCPEDVIYECAIDNFQKEQEIKELELFKDYIISCYEDDAAKGYSVSEYTIKEMEYMFWKYYFSKNKGIKLMGIQISSRDVRPSYGSSTGSNDRLGLFIIPSFINLDHAIERQQSRQIPIIHKGETFSALESLNHFSELIRRHGKEYDYSFSENATSHTYILDELLEINIERWWTVDDYNAYIKIRLI